MFIDPHVHCRDGEESYKETVRHALSVAERAGFTAIIDMPNTKPPLLTREIVARRLDLASRVVSPVRYCLFMGLLSDARQIENAVAAYHEFPDIVGFKMYAGNSTNNLGVVSLENQRLVYQTLASLGYKGVLVLHCEQQELFSQWDPSRPITHAGARPPVAEAASVRQQLRLAKETGYRGRLHIAHISVPDAVRRVRGEQDLAVTCGVTPHHLLFDMSAMERPDGLLLKMNPPLRPRSMRDELLEMLRTGDIDWVETDHAPHTLEEKLGPPYLSGVPNLHIYPQFLEWLRFHGFSEERITEITFTKANEAFGLHLTPRACTPRPISRREYKADPYSRFGVF